MKLRRLSLHGFKSFPDRTELLFHDGITAIVGPNGCGKSNISDAVRWVLGEQRASAIRGSKMEEAIFSGTAQRRPINRAEVSLAFTNEEGRLPVPHGEVEIRRIVFREGGSDYQLNRQSTRLRDILDICRDTGLGANAYTVIEQGMVDSILSDRAEERRHLFEEAAGVGRYKDRRKAAQRRLDAAEIDLSRLDDLLSEVETKVRSLARQRRRAQRYRELRVRRLALEVAVARAGLESVTRLLQDTEAALTGLTRDEPGGRAELTTAEAELERRRLESADAGRRRSEAGARMETVAREIAERERELAVAEERRAHAERRLIQIATERGDAAARLRSLDGERSGLEAECAGQHGVVESLGGRVAEVQERQSALRREVTDVRRTDEEARARENELTRQLARLEADAVNADARAEEADRRLEQVAAERAEVEAELSRLDEQGDLFAEQSRQLEERRARADERRLQLAAHVEELRAAEAGARQAVTAAESESDRLTARLASLEALEREYQGFAPAVAAVLTARAEIGGIAGPLTDFLKLPAERAAALEGALGSLLQMVVVERLDSATAVRAWLADAEGAHGGVAMLPRDALPRLHALLDTLEFAGEAPPEPVLIGRRERMDALREKVVQAAADRERRVLAREAAAAETVAAERALREAEQSLQGLEAEVRRGAADESARVGQRDRAERVLDDLANRRQELEALGTGARSEADTARVRRGELEELLLTHRQAWQEAVAALSEREAAWEAVRDEEAELRVLHARAEGALAAVERRLASTREELARTRERLEALDAEEAEHRGSMERLDDVRTGAGERLEQLFGLRDEVAAELRTLDEQLAAASDAAVVLDTRVRELRRTLDDRNEMRHRLELRRAEAMSKERSIRDRLEAEWGRPFSDLVAEAEPVDGDPDDLTAQLHEVAADIERLGPINMLAVEEHEEESTRLEFLQTQRADLVSARDDLRNAIRQINRTARELFTGTFEQIREHFRTTFRTLFEGGECDIRLEDPEEPLESPIEIIASPMGKRTQRIHLLSGGERALTALALLFAIYLVKPSPFCVLDEVDAPLDEANIGRFLAMLQEFKVTTQFIVITHHPRTMEAADWLYGVTMEEPGVSSIVGVHLDQVLTPVGAAG